MTKKKFNNILTSILIPYLKYVQKITDTQLNLNKEFRSSVFDEYDSIKEDLKEKWMKKYPKFLIDRNKIAASFYLAFVDVAKKRKFKDFNSIKKLCKNGKSNNNDVIYLFVHTIAFNVAIGIIESFIYKDKKDEKYHSYVNEYGIIAEKDELEIGYKINKFILAHKVNKLSVPSLAFIFSSIERNFKARIDRKENCKKRRKCI